MLKMHLRGPDVGAYSAPPDHLAGFKGPTSKGRGGQRRGREEREGMGRERKGRGGKGKRGHIGTSFPHFEPCVPVFVGCFNPSSLKQRPKPC